MKKVVIILLIKDEILLVNSYRIPLKEKQWELPRGFLDKKESPLKGDLRELKEETVYSLGKGQIIGHIAPNAGPVKSKVPVALIKGVKKIKAYNHDKKVLGFNS